MSYSHNNMTHSQMSSSNSTSQSQAALNLSQIPQKRGPWSPEEDRKLMELITVYGPSNWVRISNFLGTRTAKQCRERYHQNLKPSLNRSPITPEEGAYIEELVQRYGKRWAEIARHLNGRSDNAIKNWWNGGANRRRRASAQANVQQEQYLHRLSSQSQDHLQHQHQHHHPHHHQNPLAPPVPHHQHQHPPHLHHQPHHSQLTVQPSTGFQQQDHVDSQYHNPSLGAGAGTGHPHHQRQPSYSSKLQPPVVLPLGNSGASSATNSPLSANFSYSSQQQQQQQHQQHQQQTPPTLPPITSNPLLQSIQQGGGVTKPPITLPSLSSNLYNSQQPLHQQAPVPPPLQHFETDFIGGPKRRLLDSRRHSAATIVTSSYVSPSPNSLSTSRNSSISFDNLSSNDSLSSNGALRRSSLVADYFPNGSNPHAITKPSIRKRNSIYSATSYSKFGGALPNPPPSIPNILPHSYNSSPNVLPPQAKNSENSIASTHKESLPPLLFNSLSSSSLHQQSPLTLPPLSSTLNSSSSGDNNNDLTDSLTFKAGFSFNKKSPYESKEYSRPPLYSSSLNSSQKNLFKSNFSFSNSSQSNNSSASNVTVTHQDNENENGSSNGQSINTKDDDQEMSNDEILSSKVERAKPTTPSKTSSGTLIADPISPSKTLTNATASLQIKSENEREKGANKQESSKTANDDARDGEVSEAENDGIQKRRMTIANLLD